ncbi:MAG: DEAD/DEAH box helicase, partial [Bacteroidales bacterium]
TIQSIGYMELHPELRPVVVICPKLVKEKWAREIRKWMSDPGKIAILEGKTPYQIDADIYIINYDILPNDYETGNDGKKREIKYSGWVDHLADKNIEILITDECHYYKSNKAKRTKAVKKLAKASPKMIALSGTAIENRPVEIYNPVNLINPNLFPNFMHFGKKYCNGKHNGFGWDFNGSSNISELHQILTESVMIRRKKKDVLKDLPDKIYSYIPLDIANKQEYMQAQANFIDYVRANKGEKHAAKAEAAETLTRIEALKQLAANGKIDQVKEWIKDFLEGSDEKLVVFAVHRAVIDEIVKEFPDITVKVDGSTNNREAAFQTFQTDQNCRLFVGNIKAAGVGMELTASSNVAVVELPWTPGALDQAIDRLHRIGQKDAVTVHYLLAQETIEEDIAQLIDKKREIISQALDGIEVDSDTLINELISNILKQEENG